MDGFLVLLLFNYVRLILIFSTPVFLHYPKDFKDNKDLILNWINEEKLKDKNGVLKSNAGGWQSSIFKTSKIHNYLEKTIKECLINYIDKEYQIKLNTYWININFPNCFNLEHTHPGSDLSGVFWIQIPENSGDLIIKNLQSHVDYNLLECFCNSTNSKSTIILKPIVGSMTIFSSSLPHSVNSNLSNEIRLSIAFNVDIIKND